MTYRKTWIDYVLWAVYAGLCVMFLACVGNHMYAFYGGISLAGLGTFLLFPVLLCLYFGIRLVSRAVRSRYGFSAHFSVMAESLVVSVSFVFGTLLRIREGFHMAFAYEAAPAFEPGYYYEMAVMRAEEDSALLAHGMSDLFLRCLRVVFSVLGNSMAAAVLFQIFLQVMAMVFAYLAVRKAAGRFAAGTLLLLLAFSDAFIGRIYLIDPECLLLTLFLAGLCLVLYFVKASLGGNRKFGGFPGAVCVGVALGVLCYLECGCAVLFLFLDGLFTGKPSVKGGLKRRSGSLFLALAGGLAGFLGTVAVDAYVSGVSFYQGIMNWLEPYQYMGTGAGMSSAIGTECLFFAVLFLLASFTVFEFIRGGREQDYSLWFLPCILLAPAFFIDLGIVGFGSVAFFLWSVMAGLGLKGAVFGEKVEMVRAKSRESGTKDENPAALKEEKPRFIENPLPLPKKHVKREMDYDYEVSEADMHYQIEILEGDDFDF